MSSVCASLTFGLFLLVVLAAMIWFFFLRVANYILGAAAERERLSQAQTQFMMSDLLWLVVLMQVALAAVVAYVPRNSYGLFELFFFFAMFAVTALWWGTMRMVSRAGVRQMGRRGLFVTVVAPATLGILIVTGPLVLYLLMQLGEYFFERRASVPLWEHFGTQELLGVVYLLSIPPQMWLLRKGTEWALDDPYSKQLAAEALARQQAAKAKAEIVIAELVEQEAVAAENAARELENLDLDS